MKNNQIFLLIIFLLIILVGSCFIWPVRLAVADERRPNNSSSGEHLHISGVYPHLTTYGVYSQNGAHYKAGHNECGIGAVVPWAGKL